MPKKLIFTIFICFLCFVANAQDDSLSLFNQSRLKINKIGMITLGTWAIANMGTSAFRLSNTQGESKKFYEMNLYWNVVNLSLAGLGLYQSLKSSVALSAFESLQAQSSMEKVLLFNAGLDLAYIATGLYMRERGLRSEKRRDLLRGFGKSLILQGAFLFIFDLSLYSVHHFHLQKYHFLFENLQIGPTGIGFRFQF